MIVLYILLGLLLTLFLLLLIPLRVEAGFQEEFFLELRYLFLRFPLLSGEPETEEEEELKPEPQEKPKDKPGLLDRAKAAMKREGLAGFLGALGELIRLLLSFSAGILKRLRLKRFQLYLCVPGAGDAAAGAVLYGQVSAGVYAACGGLFSLLPCKDKGVTVDLAYHAEIPQIDFTARLSIRPIFLVREAAVLLFKSLKPLKKIT